MQHKGFADMPCPIARSLERVGEWWSILILRDAFKGKSRFDQFQKSLGIAPNMLTRRLNTLVESGLLERRLYSEKPPRHEYLLTPRGQDFRPVLWALMAWGNKHFPPEGETVAVVDAKTGEQAEPVLVDSRSGRVLRSPEFTVATVPAAGSRKQREGAGVSADPKVSGDAQASGDPKVRGGPRVSDSPKVRGDPRISGEQKIRVGAKARSAKQKRAGTSS